MTYAMIAWLLFLLWTLFGAWSTFPRGANADYKPFGSGLLFWLLMALILYRLFGSPLKG